MNKKNQMDGTYEINITTSTGDSRDFDVTIIAEKAKRPTVSVHGVQKDADEFVELDDQYKSAREEQEGKKKLLVMVAQEIRDEASSEGADIPEVVRFATENGRSVAVSAKYLSKKLTPNTSNELKALLRKKDYEAIVQESVSLTFPKDVLLTKKLLKQCKDALKDIIDVEIEHVFKTTSGVDTYKHVEEILDTAGDDSELVEAMTQLRKDMEPSFEAKVSSKAVAQLIK